MDGKSNQVNQCGLLRDGRMTAKDKLAIFEACEIIAAFKCETVRKKKEWYDILHELDYLKVKYKVERELYGMVG